MKKEDVKLNIWYKRTDIDYSKPDIYKTYSTHFYIIKECEKIYKCSKVIQGCNNPVTFIKQSTICKGAILNSIECSEEEINLLLNITKEYEIY